MPAHKYTTKTGQVKWYTSFWYTDWTGKRRRKKKEGFSLKREADEYEEEFTRQQKGKCDMSFASLVELYQKDINLRVREGTQYGRDSILENWIIPYFGSTPVNQITPAMIRQWQTHVMSKVNPRTGRKYSPAYLHGIHVRLSAIFNYAVTFCALASNPCKVAGTMGSTTSKSKTLNIWTLEQYRKFISEVKKPGLHVAFQMLYWTGIRVGECLALTPSDFLPTKCVHIDKTFHRLHGLDTVGAPKTENSYRDVGMPDFLYDEVLEYIRHLYGIGPNDRVFQFSKSALSAELDRVCAVAGLPKIRIHDLRHSHASLLADNGDTIAAVADRLGDTLQTATSTYIHLFPERKRQLITRLNQAAAGTPPLQSLLPTSDEKGAENE